MWAFHTPKNNAGTVALVLTLAVGAAIAGLKEVFSEEETKSEISCETYQGITGGDQYGTPKRLIFDPKPIEKRKLNPRFALLGRPNLEDSLNIGERYCFNTIGKAIGDTIYSAPLQIRRENESEK